MKVYPQISKKYSIIEHLPLIKQENLTYKMNRIPSDGRINIAFIGNFCSQKGSIFFNDLSRRLKKYFPNSSFFILGLTDGSQREDIVYLGQYDRSNLGQKLNENHIHLVIHPSVANETFSYTAQELMLLKVPFVVFPCGAPAERIVKYNYSLAEIATSTDSRALLKATLQLIDKLGKL